MNLNLIVPVIFSNSKSRPAYFNWTITSSSGSEPRFGQYACGSYWFAPAIGDTGVRIVSLLGSGIPGNVDLLTLDADPIPHAHGLCCLGTLTYASNDPSQNEVPNLPKTFTPASGSAVSLVAGMQRNEAQTSTLGPVANRGGSMDAYCILTIVHTPPPDNGANSIRPNFLGDVKQFLTWDDFDLTRLPSHGFIGSLTSAAIETERLRWTHSTEVFSMRTFNGTAWASYSEGGRAFRGCLLHDDYGANRASAFNDAVARLMGTNPLIEKKPLLAAIISEGLDQLHHVFGRSGYPGGWASGAGQWGGQFTAPAFTAALLVDPSWANRIKKVPFSNLTDSVLKGPQEMRQIMRSITGVYIWGDGHDPYAAPSTVLVQDVHKRYWNDMKWAGQYRGSTTTPVPTAGKRTAADPHRMIDGPPNMAGTGYASTSAGAAVALAGLMVMMPALRETVNHDGIIEYADRVKRFGVWASPDTASPPTLEDQSGCDIWNSNGTGCEGWRTQWGPTLTDVRKACTTEGETGRFPFRHGVAQSVGTSGPIGSNWAAIMALYDGPRYEDRLVPIGTCVAPDIYIYPDTGGTFALLWTPTWDAQIYYEVGSSLEATPTPTTSSPIYTGVFPVSSGQYIKAIAVAAGHVTSSVATSSGVIDAPPTEPDAPVVRVARSALAPMFAILV